MMDAALVEEHSGARLLDLMRGFQIPCVLAAAAELDVFNVLSGSAATAQQLAERLQCDVRAIAILLDALAGVGLLNKVEGRYALPDDDAAYLLDSSPRSVAAMLRHQANCLQRWAQLSRVVRAGKRLDPTPSVQGAQADQHSFIEAMHVVSEPVAALLVREINPGGVRCILDVGGASGTWTLAWLRAEPGARAVLLDLPDVIPLARARIEQAGLAARVQLVAGDYLTDAMPRGADVAWISAIIHQNSREQNRSLFQRIAAAMEPGGRVLIRDVVMEDSRTAPPMGALFAVNMLVGTESGGTYTLAEIREDLTAAGLSDVSLVRKDEGMNSVVAARRT